MIRWLWIVACVVVLFGGAWLIYAWGDMQPGDVVSPPAEGDVIIVPAPED